MYEQLKLENQLCFPFYALSRLITRAYQEDLDALGITYPQYLVMLVLWEKDGVTVNEIGEKLILNTNTITPLLKRMEGLGLVRRTPSETDQRKVIISLTDEGHAMQEKALEIPQHLIQKMNIELNEDTISELSLLKSVLQKYISVLKNVEPLQ